jgi:hypothetical protein
LSRRILFLAVVLLLASCGPTAQPAVHPTESTRSSQPQPTATAVPVPTDAAPTPTPIPPTPIPPAEGVLVVQPRYGDGQAMREIWVDVYHQAQDANGAPIHGEQAGSEYVGDSGTVSFVLPPGRYAVEIRVRGYEWPAFFDHEVRAGETTTATLALGRLTLVLRRADGSLVTGQWVDVYRQLQDANGQPIYGEEVDSQWIDDVGIVRFDLTPGIYALKTAMDGYPWPECQFGHVVQSGQVTERAYTLGQVEVVLRHPDGSVATGYWVDAYTQERDANGNPIRGEEARSIWAGDSGIALFDLTPGAYLLVADRNSEAYVVVDSGQTVVQDLTIAP